jgi:hypothetical protein
VRSKKLLVGFSGSLSRPDEVRSDGLASPFWESNLVKRSHEHLRNNKEVNKKVKLPVGIH